MKCPKCKSELEITGRERLETLSEHVSNPNGTPSYKDVYECSNEKCETVGNIFWNYIGELYFKDYMKAKEINYIDDNDAPFGSFQRKCNVEVYKKGLKRETKHFIIGRYHFLFEYCYIADTDGIVLKTKKKFEIRKYSKPSPENKIVGYYHILPFWRSIYYKFKFRKLLK